MFVKSIFQEFLRLFLTYVKSFVEYFCPWGKLLLNITKRLQHTIYKFVFSCEIFMRISELTLFFF